MELIGFLENEDRGSFGGEGGEGGEVVFID